jgi:MoaA/NifB/PqqE/SkfB family radical SAM enzyme
MDAIPIIDVSSESYAGFISGELPSLLDEGKISLATEQLARPWAESGPRISVHHSFLKPLWEYFYSADKAGPLIDHLDGSLDFKAGLSYEVLPEAFLLLELMLMDGQYEKVSSFGELALSSCLKDLRLHDVRARARMLDQGKLHPQKDLQDGFHPFRNQWCIDPFVKFTALERGAVNLCCTNWMNEPVGSFVEDDFDHLWNSDVALDIRRSIHDGSFQYCNKMACPYLKEQRLPAASEVTAPYDMEVVEKQAVGMPVVYPRKVVLSEDPICNLTCPSCRTEQKKADEDQLVRFEEVVFPKLMETYTAELRICGNGDPFASQHYMRLMKSLDPKVNKLRRLSILTNGVLFSPRVWETLSNLQGYRVVMNVSIDAATPETYAKVRRGGDWDRLQEALAFMQQLREQGEFRKFHFNYVVQEDNFREMPEFVRMAKKYSVDKVFFAPFQKTGVHIEDAEYNRQAVYLKGHPDHQEYREILARDIMQDPIVSVV